VFVLVATQPGGFFLSLFCSMLRIPANLRGE